MNVCISLQCYIWAYRAVLNMGYISVSVSLQQHTGFAWQSSVGIALEVDKVQIYPVIIHAAHRSDMSEEIKGVRA